MRRSLSSAAPWAAVVLLLMPVLGLAQQPSTAEILKAITPRNLGPTSMGGRISELAVYEKEPRIFYAATASGGLWRTNNGGITYDCVFQYEETVALGAVTVDQDNPDVVWVGTGEQNSRNSTSWGNGVYKSTDGGKTWSHMGLADTKHISKIKIDPRNKDVVYVGALGHLWGANEERGLYKTTDGGKTWSRILYVNDKTGVIDMVVHPTRPDTMWVAMWERMRLPYRWASGGPGSGLYKTTNGGRDWKKITEGMPEGDIGRIGLDVYRKNPNVLVATIEASTPGEGWRRTATGGFFKSTNGGESWTKQSNQNPRPFYFSMPRIDPNDENRVYVPAVNLHVSDDSGKTWRNMPITIHVDFHAMWIDPKDSNYLLVGEDGGVALSRDKGEKWEHQNYLPIAQFYAVGVDMRKPYWVYGGLQDNGTWGVPTQTNKGFVAHYDARFINGGDGFHAQVDPSDWRIVYAESQGGAVNRHNIQTGESRSIRPVAPPAAEGQQREVYRWNWSTPFIISPHNPHTLWLGGNKLFKTVDRGDNWTVMSPDLTTNDPEKQQSRGGVTPEDTGAERHCTIITISESPRKAGLVWVGTDDGNVQLTRDDGKTWENVTGNFSGVPRHTWVSRVVASRYDTARAYVTFDGHRNNDYKPYIFVTEDYGQTWAPLHEGFGDESVYVLVEGRQNSNFLAVGTEMGLYFSLDRGKSWTKYHKDNGFPTVRVDDMTIHPRDGDLVVATHGRAFWIIPVSALEQLTPSEMEKDVALLRPAPMYGLGKVFGQWYEGDRTWQSPNTQPSGQIYYYLKSATEEKVQVEVFAADGTSMGTVDGKGEAGLNMVAWRPRGRAAFNLTTGQYRVVLRVGEQEFTTSLSYEDVSGNMGH